MRPDVVRMWNGCAAEAVLRTEIGREVRGFAVSVVGHVRRILICVKVGSLVLMVRSLLALGLSSRISFSGVVILTTSTGISGWLISRETLGEFAENKSVELGVVVMVAGIVT